MAATLEMLCAEFQFDELNIALVESHGALLITAVRGDLILTRSVAALGFVAALPAAVIVWAHS